MFGLFVIELCAPVRNFYLKVKLIPHMFPVNLKRVQIVLIFDQGRNGMVRTEHVPGAPGLHALD